MKYKHKIFFVLLLLSSCLFLSGQEKEKYFIFNKISETDYRKAIHENFNAVLLPLNDSIRLEKALNKIDKTYSQSEIDLASSELCESPRCLLTFGGYCPNLDILVFYIQDYHSKNAIFIKENKETIGTKLERFKGSYGVMSKKGLWVGLERNDCDNYLQIEICKITKRGTWSIINFNFQTMDINLDEKEPIFWVNKNTIYIATVEFSNENNIEQENFYKIKFEY